ncbi:concanavalin A-like lectin/glucanase domain-containing protein [Mucidula mucida]|nr:concanavalin A-like lectin/glucanase domain-containing protein [Mucidula mucida]
MRSSTSLTLLSIASAALAFGVGHDGAKRHHRMKRAPASLKGRTDSVVAYYGYQNKTAGACGWESVDTDYIVGLSTDYVTPDSTDNCGKQVTITLADDSSKSVTCTVTDSCTNCDMYLSIAAFESLAGSLDGGKLDVVWDFVDSSSTISQSNAVDVALPTSAAAETTTYEPTPATETSTTATSASTGGTSTDGWTNTNYLTGSSIFDFFSFETGASDNSGCANYVSRDSGLVYTDSNGYAVVAIDSTEYASLRNSVRMVSNTEFNVGSLIIVDVQEMPAVCGTWPAIWLNGGCTWPDCGEIDILEGVNMYTQNIFSVHTNDGCSLDQSEVDSLTSAALKTTSTLSCNANADSTSCGFNLDSQTSYGQPFNSASGGTYAVSITDDAISFYFWNQGSVPSDITSNTPTPSSWGSALVTISNTACDISSHFTDLSLIINTNLGGTFAEGVWNTANNGQSTSCAASTGFSSAYEYVTQVGSAFADAKFTIRSIATYSQ